jgi:hypothetical protein
MYFVDRNREVLVRVLRDSTQEESRDELPSVLVGGAL